jgi:hypothetical protein
MDLALLRKNPVERIISSNSACIGLGIVLGRGIALEKGGRHHIHPLVGALGRKNGGHQQLQGV